MNQRLEWTSLLYASLSSATDGDVEQFLISDTADPLHKRLSITFREPLPGPSWNPFQALVHGFAVANDCMVQRIKKVTSRSYQAEILTKRRLGPPKKNNPLLMSGWQSEYERDKFLRHLRDKIGTWLGVRHGRIAEQDDMRDRRSREGKRSWPTNQCGSAFPDVGNGYPWDSGLEETDSEEERETLQTDSMEPRIGECWDRTGGGK